MGGPSVIDSALSCFDEAIQCDSMYFLAYSNKLSALLQRKDFSKGLSLINIMNLKFKGDPNRFDDLKAGILEQLNEKDSAYKYYSSSLKYYSALTRLFPDSAEVYFGKAVLLDKLYGESNAINLLDSFILEHPKNISSIMYKEMFINLKTEKDSTNIFLK